MSLPIRDCYPVSDRLLAASTQAPPTPRSAASRVSVDSSITASRTSSTSPTRRTCSSPTSGISARARRIHHSIVDMGTTTIPHMMRILDDVDAALADGGAVYVHCWGGIGRTGTVVGCWLVRHGLDDGDAIARIAALRRRVVDARMPSPQTTAQREMVRTWKSGR